MGVRLQRLCMAVAGVGVHVLLLLLVVVVVVLMLMLMLMLLLLLVVVLLLVSRPVGTCVVNVVSMCIKTQSAPRLQEVLVC